LSTAGEEPPVVFTDDEVLPAELVDPVVVATVPVEDEDEI